MVRAASYLILRGPVTGQERWDENAGYSASTLATVIAALVCAAELAREHHQEYADWLAACVFRRKSDAISELIRTGFRSISDTVPIQIGGQPIQWLHALAVRFARPPLPAGGTGGVRGLHPHGDRDVVRDRSRNQNITARASTAETTNSPSSTAKSERSAPMSRALLSHVLDLGEYMG